METRSRRRSTRTTGRGLAEPIPDPGTVLVTGAADDWGGRLVMALEGDPSIHRIIAVDQVAPRVSFARAEVVVLDLKNPLIVDLLAHRKVQTVFHLQLKGHHLGRERMFDNNVLGTRHLLAAAREAAIKRIVVRSSTFVYGADSSNPFYLKESWPVAIRTRHPYVRDLVDMERDFEEFWQIEGERPQLAVLRFAPIVGPACLSQMTRYLRNPVLYTMLGFDPLWQFVHEDDVVSAMLQGLRVCYDGAVNIAGDGVLPLSQVAALMGKHRVPIVSSVMPALLRALSLAPQVAYPSIPTGHLKFICLADTRRMRSEFGFSPRYTTRETLESFRESLLARQPDETEGGEGSSEFARRALEDVLEPRIPDFGAAPMEESP